MVTLKCPTAWAYNIFQSFLCSLKTQLWYRFFYVILTTLWDCFYTSSCTKRLLEGCKRTTYKSLNPFILDQRVCAALHVPHLNAIPVIIIQDHGKIHRSLHNILMKVFIYHRDIFLNYMYSRILTALITSFSRNASELFYLKQNWRQKSCKQYKHIFFSFLMFQDLTWLQSDEGINTYQSIPVVPARWNVLNSPSCRKTILSK